MKFDDERTSKNNIVEICVRLRLYAGKFRWGFLDSRARVDHYPATTVLL